MKKSRLFIAGFIFAIITCQAQISTLFSFDSINGSHPYGDLLYDSTYLYGMTYNGGKNNDGTLFKIKTDGTGFNTVVNFNGTNGYQPDGSLIAAGAYLYGMTSGNGKTGSGKILGNIFKIQLDSTKDTALMDFKGTNGIIPGGSLYYDGTYLYGMTYAGGTNNDGIVFKIKPDGTGYDTILNFNGTNGDSPLGSLFYDGSYLYGMASQGGKYNDGVIIKIYPNGSGYETLLNFNDTNGYQPEGSLISDGTFLYGMTTGNDSTNFGNIFKIKPDGSGDTVLYNFDSIHGSNPDGSLVYDGTYLYGMTLQGGTSDNGTLFKIKPDGTGHTVLFNFDNIHGSYPNGSLISDGTFLYGMTSYGGTYGYGTIFKYQYCTAATQSVFTQSLTVCAGNSVTVGSHTYTNNGTYTDVLGCDSIVTTNLTVLPPNTFTQSRLICLGDSITVGHNTHKASGTYTDTLISKVNGCDSLIITHLSIYPANNTFTQYPTGCKGYTLTVGIHAYDSTGTYTDTLISHLGCGDSIIITHLTVGPISAYAVIFTQTDTICPGDSIKVGIHTYTVTGTYIDTLSQQYTRCDSIVTTNLTALPICITGIREYNLETVNVYPNPANGIINLNTGQLENVQVNIYTVYGESIYQHTIISSNFQIDLSAQPNGVYFMRLISDQGVVNRKIVISH